MGWLFKGFLAIAALFLLGAGLWWISAIIFVYLLFSSRPGKQKIERAVLISQPVEGADDDSARASKKRGGRFGVAWRWRYLLGGLLFLAALFGMSSGGTFSPLVFGGLGALCILWAPLARGGHLPEIGYSPLRESTMLRNVLLPFQWLTIEELKLSSQESARALSVLHDDLVVIAPPSEKPSAYLVVKQLALGYRGAEAKMSEKVRKLAGLLGTRGTYLLPLDSQEAVRRFQPGFEALKMDLGRESVLEAVGHSPYDILVVKPDGGQAKSLGAYRVDPSIREREVEAVIGNPNGSPVVANVPLSGRASLPIARDSFERPPLLWEVISCLQERFHFSEPDAYTMFLNNMHLSRGVAPGAKMSLATGDSAGRLNGSTLTVESLGGTPVELTRAQLRTIVKIYD
jgi:hypothetical protein